MDMINFLHNKGYNYFTIPKLTITEINMLLEVENKIARNNKKNINSQPKIRRIK